MSVPRGSSFADEHLAFNKIEFLNDMWPADEVIWAKHATHECQLDLSETGEIYYITVSAEKSDGYVIGLTGWFEDSENAIGIRWHCIHPALRGRGISKQALQEMLKIVPTKYEFAYESATNSAVKHFLDCGFEIVTDKDKATTICKNAGYPGTALQFDLRRMK